MVSGKTLWIKSSVEKEEADISNSLPENQEVKVLISACGAYPKDEN